MAIGEWYHEADKETKRSLPAGFNKDCFKRDLISASSGAVSSIKFSACTSKKCNLSIEDVCKRDYTRKNVVPCKDAQNQI